MNRNNDKRSEPKTERGQSESRPSSPNTSTADNASVYQQPPIEQATKDGKANKMDQDSNQDRKHTP